MKAIDDSLGMLTQSTRKGEEIDDFVLKALTDNYESFVKGADAEWKAIDETLNKIKGKIILNGEEIEATGGQLPIFDIQAFKTRYDDVIQNDYGGAKGLPPEEFTKIGNDINELTLSGPKDGFTSFNGMKNLRKNIQDTLMDPRLSTGATTARRYLSDVRDKIDDMMYGRVKMSFAGTGPGGASIMKRAMKQLENARVLDASKEGREEVRQALAQKYIDEALTAAKKDFSDPDKFNGVLFNSKISSLGKSGKVIFGDDWNQVQNIARSLAYGGIKRIDDDILERVVSQNPSDDIVTTLKSIKDAQVGLEEAMSSKVLRDLAEGKLDPQDAAVSIMSPKTTTSQMNKIMEFFKDDPVAQETIRKTIINDILGSVDEDIFVDAKAAFSLKNSLNAYKPKMLEKFLGKQAVADLNEFADDLMMLSDTGRRGAGSLAADQIRTGAFTAPVKNAGKMARFKFLDYLFNRPSTMRRALELKTGRKTPEEAAASLSQALNEAASQVGSGKTVGERVSGVTKGLGALNRGQVMNRQVASQLLTSPQQIRGTPPANQTSVPDVRPPVNLENIQVNRKINSDALRRQANLRERAKRNPYIASTLLGGLGSAGLL